MSRQVVISETAKDSSKHNSLSRRDFLKLSATFGAAAAISDFTLNEPVRTLVAGAAPTAVQQDQWIKTSCRVCSTIDCIRVHVVDGLIEKIDGDPSMSMGNPSVSKGKICARGSAGHYYVYDPYRVKVPLRRTNPQKGIGVDPKWVEISWDEAYNMIAAEAKKVRAKGENGTMWFSSGGRLAYSQSALRAAFDAAMSGDCYKVDMGMNWCGHILHYIHRTAHGGWVGNTDYPYNKYQLIFGRENGLVYDAIAFAELLVNAHEKGAKTIVLTPNLSYGVNIVDEWVPILPATDGAFASGMLNVLIHELGIYDVDFIKKWTDGPYLVRADNGYYARDTATNKPLIWDPVDNKAKTFDDKTIKDYAVEGSFTVGGVSATPSWQLLKNAVKSMTPEWAAPITTVPAATIRRIANEWGQAAQIGSKLIVDGVERTYRPVAASFGSNPSNHVHGFANSWSILMLLTIVGAPDTPGSSCMMPNSYLSQYATNPQSDVQWKTTRDGLIPHPAAAYSVLREEPWNNVFPPKTVELDELFPFGDHKGALSLMTMAHPNDYWGVGKAHRIEFGFGHAYGMMSMYAISTMAEVLSTVPFLVLSSIWLEEANELADIVLPDRCYLEEYQLNKSWFEQPVVEPLNPIPHIYDVFVEICERTGVLYGKGGFNDLANGSLKDPYKLDLNKKYTTEQMFDATCKSTNGKDLNWWKENGGDKAQDKTQCSGVYEWYKTKNQRLPIYVEVHKRVADQLRQNLEKNGVTWDYADYATLPTWIPSHIHKDTPPYDLIEVAYLQNTGGYMSTNVNPWVAEINEKFDPYGLYVWINEDTAKSRGIANGDLIWVESEQDKRQAHAKLSQAIHPKVIAVSRHFGRWGMNSIVKDLADRHLGLPHQAMRPDKLEYIDKLTDALENAVKVKVYKV